MPQPRDHCLLKFPVNLFGMHFPRSMWLGHPFPRRGARPPRSLVAAMCGAASALVAACAQPIPVAEPQPIPAPRPPVSTGPIRPRASTPVQSDVSESWAGSPRWPIKTSEPVDLWLHAFALLTDDSTKVPLYRRGYRDSITVVKNRLNVLTALDTNRAYLSRQMAGSQKYQQAQLLAFEFGTWEAMRASAERYIQGNSDTRRSNGADRDAGMSSFARLFPSAADRDFLRVLVDGVQDERIKFYGAEHARLVRSRSAVVTAIDSLWQRTYRARFERFLVGSGQRNADIVLSMPVGAEGRTGLGRERQVSIAVPFPDRVSDAPDALMVLAHEMTAGIVAAVVRDNSTVVEQRSGAMDRLAVITQVRAGAMLIARVAPELSDAYMRYYLGQTGVAVQSGDVTPAFTRAFEISATVRDDVQRQIGLALSAN